MARIRTVKPEFWVSEQITECSPIARLLFIGLWNFCDDRGVHPVKPRQLKARVFPSDDFAVAQIEAWIAELVHARLLREFQADEDGEAYWHVTGWNRHQKIDRPSNKHPAPPASDSPNTRRDSNEPTSDQRREPADDSTSARRAPPPGVDSKGEDRKGEEMSSPKARRTPKGTNSSLPSNFDISNRVKAWAATKGYNDLELHLEAFKSKAAAKGYRYADWDEAFMGAIRDDWAGVRQACGAARRSVLHADELFTGGRA